MASANFSTSGETLATLDVKNKLWPGGPLGDDYEYQFVEGEFMKEDEYDIFLRDPSDFMISLLPTSRLRFVGAAFQTAFTEPHVQQF